VRRITPLRRRAPLRRAGCRPLWLLTVAKASLTGPTPLGRFASPETAPVVERARWTDLGLGRTTTSEIPSEHNRDNREE
jgi:hypothetical protein